MKCAYCGRDATEILPNKISSTNGEIAILYLASNMSLACPRCIAEDNIPIAVHDYSVLQYNILEKQFTMLDPLCKDLLEEPDNISDFRHNLEICIKLCFKYKAREPMRLA